MKTITALRAVYASGAKPIITITLDLTKKDAPHYVVVGETVCVTQGVTDFVQGRKLGRILADLMTKVATERWPDQRSSIKIIAEGCRDFAIDAIDAHAPDRTLQVRAGCLFPMNRLPVDGDTDTLTLSSVLVES